MTRSFSIWPSYLPGKEMEGKIFGEYIFSTGRSQWPYLEHSRLTRTRLEILPFRPWLVLLRYIGRESPWNVPGGSLVSSRPSPPNAIRASLDLTGLNHHKDLPRSWTFSSCDQLPRILEHPREYTAPSYHLIVPPPLRYCFTRISMERIYSLLIALSFFPLSSTWNRIDKVLNSLDQFFCNCIISL